MGKVGGAPFFWQQASALHSPSLVTAGTATYLLSPKPRGGT